MRLLELSENVKQRAMWERLSRVKNALKLYKKNKDTISRQAFFDNARKFNQSYKRVESAFPPRVSNFIRESRRVQQNMLRLREVGYDYSSQFPLHPEDRRDQFGNNRNSSPFDRSRHLNPYQGQNTVPLKRPQATWKKVAKYGALTGLALAGAGAAAAGTAAAGVGAYLLTGAASGINRRAKLAAGIKYARQKLEDTGGTFMHNLGTGAPLGNGAKGFTKTSLNKLASHLSRHNTYGQAAWRGIKKAVKHPIKHMKRITGYDWLNRI